MSAAARFQDAIARIVGTFAVLGFLAPAVMLMAAIQSQPSTAALPPPDVTNLGPQVGEKVPDFSLPDQHGQTRTLSSLMGPKGLVLAFNRSADW